MSKLTSHVDKLHHKGFTHQSGFTLIEMSIVLVIVGLLVAGVMQGQSLLRAARVNDVITTANDLRYAVKAFKDRYKALPGDHPTATAEIQGASGNGNGNGVISNAESGNVPDHLFNAGFIKGGSGTIRTSYGGAWVVAQTVATGGGSPCGAAVSASAPVVNNVVLLGSLSGDAAREIDTKLDDGVYNSGSVRGSVDYNTTGLVCISMPL